MSALSVRCPVTGQIIDTGVDTDPVSFHSIITEAVAVACPLCGSRHNIKLMSGQFAVEEPIKASSTSL